MAVGVALAAIATASAGLVVLGAATQRDHIFGLLPAFQPGNPATVVAWASAVVMAIAAGAAMFVDILRRGAGLSAGGWPIVAAAFVVMSGARLAAPLALSWGVTVVMIAAAFSVARSTSPRERAATWLGLALIAAAPAAVGAGGAGGLASLLARCLEWGGALVVTVVALSSARGLCDGAVTACRTPLQGQETPGTPIVPISASGWLPRGLAIVGGLVTASAGLAVMHHVWRLPVQGFHLLSYVDLEGNIPSWYSSMLLLAAAVAAALLSLGERARRGPHWRAWRVLAVGFAAMSCDEAAGLHEHLTAPLRFLLDDAPAFRYPLVLPGGAIAVATAVYLTRFLRELPRASRRLLVSSGALYLAGALGFETMGGWYDPTLHGESVTYLVLTHAEETCEMLGVTGVLYGMLRHFEQTMGALRLEFE